MAYLEARERNDQLLKSYKECIFQAWGIDAHHFIPNLPGENCDFKGTDILMLRRLVMLCGLECDYKRVKEILTSQCLRKIEAQPTLNPYHVTVEDLDSTLAIVRNRSGMSSAIGNSQKDENVRPLEWTEDLGVWSSGVSNSITSTWNPSLVVDLSKKRRASGIGGEEAEEVSKRRRILENISQTAKKLDCLSLTDNPSPIPGLGDPTNQLTPDSTEPDMESLPTQ